MAAYNFKTVNTAIVTTIKGISLIKEVQDIDDLTETIPDQDTPLAQVYPDGWANASEESTTQIITFGGGSDSKSGLRQHSWTHIVDIYVNKRSRFSEAMSLWSDIAQAVIEKIDDQPANAPFGSSAIKSYQYAGERVIVGISNEDWLVCRVTIVMRLF